MKTKIVLTAVGLAVLAVLPALAQDSDHSWSKQYTVAGKPTLNLEISDANVDVHSCGECREVRIHVEIEGGTLSAYRLEESQSGDRVHFLLKEKPEVGIHFHVTLHRSTHVTVDTPGDLTLEAKTSDGRVNLTGLKGEIALTSGDGDVTLDQVSGTLRVKAGDGHVRIVNAAGALVARMSDGSLTVDGTFHALELHTSDGRLDVSLHEGTKLTEASTIQTSDGSVNLRIAQDFAADLEVHTSDGHLTCALPLTMDNYQSGSGHEIHGRMNGGGVPFTIHTSDGNVKIDRL